ncbi:MAG: hypothetical protein QOE55_5641, partial [Acidobacteriaceae bacterium]|nr:hypothetical protein [Acidobacteriaceae bacterium]
DLLSIQGTLNHLVGHKKANAERSAQSCPYISPGSADQMQGRVFLRHIHGVRRLGYFSNSSHGVSLRSLLPLDDVEFHFVTFL